MTRANYLHEQGGNRDPTEVSDLLGPVLERAGRGTDLRLARLVEVWAEVAGDRWRGRSHPVGIRDGTLLVEVATGSDASYLRYDVEALRGRIGDRFGPGLVDSVRLRVQRAPTPQKSGE